MGLTKRWLEKIEARGYGDVPGKYVCYHCLGDYGLRQFIKENATERKCNYCNKYSRMNISLELETLIDYIMQCIKTEWMSPEDSGTPYETREGGWLVEPTHLYDIFWYEHPLDVSEKLFEDIVNPINNLHWSKSFSTPFPELEEYELWDRFCHLIKHEVRYFAKSIKKSNKFRSMRYLYADPRDILNHISKTVINLNMIKTIPAGTKIYRVRLDSEKRYSTAKELGTAPQIKAIYANRMSPAGVSLFYGSEKISTAIRETRGTKISSAIASIGQFETTQNMNIIDLTSLPPVPSIYDEQIRDQRTIIKFMKKFCEDFSKPITKDEKAHLEYVPTQVITEYFRYLLSGKLKVKGIKYSSAADDNGISYVLFVNNDECIESGESVKKSKLRLSHVTYKRLRAVVN